MGKIIGLARESTTKKIQDLAIDYQVEKLKAYGCTEIYIDRESGRKQDRLTHEKLLRSIASGEVSEVVATNLTRMGRSSIAIRKIIDAVLTSNRSGNPCKLTLFDGNADPSTALGRAFLMQQAVYAELEAELISERAIAGWQNKRRLGRAFKAIFGFKTVDGNYVYDDRVTIDGTPYWKVALEMIEVYETHRSLGSIRLIFDKYPELLDLPTQSGNARFPKTIQGFRNWLTNPVLKGELHYKNPHQIFKNHKGLIDAEQFDRIGEILSFNSEHHGFVKPKEIYPLTGLVRCGICGGSMNHTTKSKKLAGGNEVKRYYHYYSCQRAKNKLCSNNKNYPVPIIEEKVIDKLIETKQEISTRASAKAIDEKPERLIALEEKLARLELVNDGDVHIEAAISAVRAEINLMSVPDKKQEIDHERLKKALLICGERSFWQNINPANKGEIFRTLISRIDCSGEDIIVQLKI